MMESGTEEEISSSQEIDFCTLGMFIIDEIHYLPPKASQYDIIGGAGSYSSIGARLFSPRPNSKKIGWIIDKGSDFPTSIESIIRSWQTSCLFRLDTSRLTTRGWNSYDLSEDRAFHYATPKLRLDENSLSGPLLRSKAYHLICSPTRCVDLVTSILSRRKQLSNPPPRPLFIWEPVPDLCVPQQLLETTRALSYVDICSPNHIELGSLMSSPAVLPNGSVDTDFVESATEQLLGSMPISSFAIVVRAGKDGCYIGKNGGGIKKRRASIHKPTKIKKTKQSKRPVHGHGGLSDKTDFEDLFARLNSAQWSDEEDSEEDEEPDWGIWTWLPAFHTDPSKVVDPTGGGNAFLGGLAVGLARGKGLEEAAKMATVSASFAIEQVGMPTLGTDGMGHDTWNGAVPEMRLWDYQSRLSGLQN